MHPSHDPSSRLSRAPWRVDRRDDEHALVTNASAAALDFVRVIVHGPHGRDTEHWGQVLAGETVELCLCDLDPRDCVVTLAWFRPDNGVEYLWRFVL